MADVHEESLVTQALEQISRGIRALEGLPVEVSTGAEIGRRPERNSWTMRPETIRFAQFLQLTLRLRRSGRKLEA